MNFGTKEINNFIFGSKNVLSIWFGNNKVWESGGSHEYEQEGSIVTLSNSPYSQSGTEVTIQ